MKFRIENDSMGDIRVPEQYYWGAQTQRSKKNFCIGSEKFPMSFIKAYALVKKVAAQTNYELGRLDKEILLLIEKSSDEIIQEKLNENFQLSVWQTGSGTQTNMNINEVIANRSNEINGKGKLVHPNDHVNKSQSTNDSFPTAMHVACCFDIYENLYIAIDKLIKTFDEKSKEFINLIKMGRTHLQDATPITLGQEISAWSYQLKSAKENIKASICGVLNLAQGGTAVGTGLNAHPKYAEKFAKKIANISGLPFVSSPNKFAALATHDSLVFLSGSLNTLACALLKIVNDIRWLSSGPRGGLGEIFIAANEPGSSIMPGKINPTQAEAVSMVCCQVIGNHTTVSIAGSQGNFQLNVFKPVIIFNVLQSINLLSDAIISFDKNCAKSIQANIARLDELKNRSLMLVTALAPHIGYDKSAIVAKKAHNDGTTLKEAVVSLNIMSDIEFDKLVCPENMINPS